MTSPGVFTCEECGGTFPKAWSDDEALDEALDQFGAVALSVAAVVCDDCYRELGF